MSETTVPTGQTVNGAVVGSGDDQRVDGTTNDTVVNQGGTQFVNGTANSTIINYGGSQIVNGVVNNTIVNYVGDQRIYSGSANDTILNGGTQVIYGGLTQGTIINDGGYQVSSAAVQRGLLLEMEQSKRYSGAEVRFPIPPSKAGEFSWSTQARDLQTFSATGCWRGVISGYKGWTAIPTAV